MKNIYYEYEDNEGIKTDSVYLKHEKILNEMAESRAVAIDKTESGTYSLRECCDGYYSYELNREKCLELSEIFKEIADKV